MTYSNKIAANVIRYVRAGSRAELEDACAELAEADRAVFTEHHRLERAFADPAECCKAHRELLDLIGWIEEEDPQSVEIDPRGDHLWAVREALERFERDNAGVGTPEIEAFRLDVGLRFASGGA